MRCNICYLPIHDQSTQILCPRCTNPFHYDHLAAWLLNESKCPVCRETLSDPFREDLKPKTEKDRRRLEQILYTLDGLGDVLGKWEGSRKRKKRLERMRKLDSDEEDEPGLPFMKLIVPLILFFIWLIVLTAIFG
ncbi:MAG: hypothetical protein ACXAD7_13595 [Candidatus Kariarchaeaceae archaeon]|jgi:hypothetical protein